MKKCVYAFLLLISSHSVLTAQMLQWKDALQADPLSVKSLDCSGLKWDSLPLEIYRFANLEVLDLSKNKLPELPEQFVVLTHLKQLNLFPLELCQLTQLQVLHLDRNLITKIPAQIAQLENLQELDLYANAIEDFGEGLFSLPQLKVLNLEGVMYGTVFAKSFTAKLPQTKVLMDPPCKCLD
jgi:Leucine-rich repeat (LRR) protein